jgi:hypothetical protein
MELTGRPGIRVVDLSVEAMALPIAGPSISFYDAAAFAKSVGAKMVIPVHC